MSLQKKLNPIANAIRTDKDLLRLRRETAKQRHRDNSAEFFQEVHNANNSLAI